MHKLIKKNITPFAKKVFKKYLSEEYTVKIKEYYEYVNSDIISSELGITVGDSSPLFVMKHYREEVEVTLMDEKSTNFIVTYDDFNEEDFIVLIKKYITGLRKLIDSQLFIGEINRNIKNYDELNGMTDSVRTVVREDDINELMN